MFTLSPHGSRWTDLKGKMVEWGMEVTVGHGHNRVMLGEYSV
jgi:hypothetical protein